MQISISGRKAKVIMTQNRVRLLWHIRHEVANDKLPILRAQMRAAIAKARKAKLNMHT